VNQPDILHDKNERNDFFIALGIIALAAAFLLYYAYGRPYASALGTLDEDATELNAEIPEAPLIYESDEKLEEVESDIVETDSEVVASPAPVEADEPHELDEVVEYVKEEMSEANDKVEAAVEDLKDGTQEVISSAAELAEDVVEEVDEVADNLEESVSDLKEQVEEVVAKTESEVKKVVPPVVSSNSNDKCHISVGLYKEQKNINKIISRLESAGFDAYTKNFPRSTQVGVYVTCQRSQAMSILSEIRTDFARDAYIEEFR